MKIVILDGYCENPGDLSWDEFRKLGDVTVYDRTPANLIDERIGDADILIVNKIEITRDIMERHENLKYIGLLSTGYNIIDLEAARKKNIPVCNIPAYSTQAVAQHTYALLLEICNKVAHHSDAVMSGRWSNCEDFCFWDGSLIELAGKTLGCIGFGSIGKAVAGIAHALGMKVVATGSRPTKEGEALADYVSTDELFAVSDVISIHCPLLPETKGLINKDNIAKMKDGVIILNTARGPVINESDLADALNSGKVLAAGVDVVSYEPMEADNPLLSARNILITPHIAWAPLDTRQRLMDIAVRNVQQFLAGHPVNVVN